VTRRRAVDKLRTPARYVEAMGWWATLRLALPKASGPPGLAAPRAVGIRPAGVRFPRAMRTGDSSDGAAVREIFLLGTCGRLADLPAPEPIPDLGANVGGASVHFPNRFPKVRAPAVEPGPASPALCRRSLAPYGDRARVVEGAVWPERARLALSRSADGDGRERATQVRERRAGDDGEDVAGWDVASPIDLAGAWLERVDNLCIELHGNERREAFRGALACCGHRLETPPHSTICRNLRRRAQPARVS